MLRHIEGRRWRERGMEEHCTMSWLGTLVYGIRIDMITLLKKQSSEEKPFETPSSIQSKKNKSELKKSSNHN